MAYVSPNFKTKKALKEAVAAGQAVIVFQPNRMFGSDKEFFGQTVGIEGPHYPKPILGMRKLKYQVMVL